MTTEELEQINADLETARAEWQEANAKNRVNSTVERVAWRRYSDAVKRYIAVIEPYANGWQGPKKTISKKQASKKQALKQGFVDALTDFEEDGLPTVDYLMAYFEVSKRTALRRIKESGYKVENGKVVKA